MEFSDTEGHTYALETFKTNQLMMLHYQPLNVSLYNAHGFDVHSNG